MVCVRWISVVWLSYWLRNLYGGVYLWKHSSMIFELSYFRLQNLHGEGIQSNRDGEMHGGGRHGSRVRCQKSRVDILQEWPRGVCAYFWNSIWSFLIFSLLYCQSLLFLWDLIFAKSETLYTLTIIIHCFGSNVQGFIQVIKLNFCQRLVLQNYS